MAFYKRKGISCYKLSPSASKKEFDRKTKLPTVKVAVMDSGVELLSGIPVELPLQVLFTILHQMQRFTL